EAKTIQKVVERVLATEIADEILIIDDGSTDGTRELLPSLENEISRIIIHPENRTNWAAVRTGLDNATGNILLIPQDDFEYDPREYPTLLQPIHEGITDVVYGSRFLGGPRKAMFFWNMIANRILTLTTNILYNSIISDMETCYKVFRIEVLRELK